MQAKGNVTVLTERGQTSIPAELRQDLDLKPGQRLLWEKVDDHALRVVVLEETKPAGAMAMLGFARTFRSDLRTTADWMRELREGES
jgi:AbrB family looped-hinge helix DNA binding protein